MDPLQTITESLPPKTDPLSWLVILEINLTSELLPNLEGLLQKNPDVTSTVGWDLIPLLLRFPDSHACLKVIGRYGNPRECVIKVCEQLRELNFEDRHDGVDDLSKDEDDEVLNAKTPGSLNLEELHMNQSKILEEYQQRHATELDKLVILIRLLATLHPRIETKYPSRFLSTSLSALLSTYSDAVRFGPSNDVTLEIIRLIKTLSGVKRPHLPQRYSSQQTLSGPIGSISGDPEAVADEQPAPEEKALTTRLLSSFVTHVLEDYVTSTPDPGLAWAARLYESYNKGRIVPGKSAIERFSREPSLQERDSVVGQLVALARDLNLDDDELLKTLTQPVVQIDQSEDGPPSSPSDIPLSEAGSLFLLTSRIASSVLFSSSAVVPPLFIFPDQAAISFKFIGQAEAGGSTSIGSEAEAVIDAVIAIGLYCTYTSKFGDVVFEGDDKFNSYLQSVSLLSANSPNSNLRFLAHTLTSVVLHSHPHDLLRLAFIRDTLEHCPFENLKGSAVTWFKDEIIAAASPENHSVKSESKELSIFATPVALDSLGLYIFPDIDMQVAVDGEPKVLVEQWTLFKANYSFYLASLNLYYFLLSSTNLHEPLELGKFRNTFSVDKLFIGGLRMASSQFQRDLKGKLASEEGIEGAKARSTDLDVMNDFIDRIEHATKGLKT